MVVGERAGDSQCLSRPMQLPADEALVAPCPEQLMRVVTPKDTKEVGRAIASELRRCRLRRRPSILRRLKRRVVVSAQDSAASTAFRSLHFLVDTTMLLKSMLSLMAWAKMIPAVKGMLYSPAVTC